MAFRAGIASGTFEEQASGWYDHIFFLVVKKSFCRVSVLVGGFRAPDIGLEAACNEDSCRGIPLKREKCHLKLKRHPKYVKGALPRYLATL